MKKLIAILALTLAACGGSVGPDDPPCTDNCGNQRPATCNAANPGTPCPKTEGP